MRVSAFLYYLAVCLLMLVTQVIPNWQYAILALSLKAGRAACSIVHMYYDDLTAPKSWTFKYAVFSYYKQCFSEHPCAYIIIHKCKHIRRIDSQEVELLGQRFVCLTDLAKLLSQRLYPFYSHQQCVRVPISPHPHVTKQVKKDFQLQFEFMSSL